MKSIKDEAKKKQAYTPCFVAGTCGNCVHFRSKFELPKWMRENAEGWPESNKVETDLRCGIGGFEVKKRGSCAEWAGKP